MLASKKRSQYLCYCLLHDVVKLLKFNLLTVAFNYQKHKRIRKSIKSQLWGKQKMDFVDYSFQLQLHLIQGARDRGTLKIHDPCRRLEENVSQNRNDFHQKGLRRRRISVHYETICHNFIRIIIQNISLLQRKFASANSIIQINQASSMLRDSKEKGSDKAFDEENYPFIRSPRLPFFPSNSPLSKILEPKRSKTAFTQSDKKFICDPFSLV